jgi:hypothetical protein
LSAAREGDLLAGVFNASDEDGIEGGKIWLKQARDNPEEPEYEESRLDAEGIVRADELETFALKPGSSLSDQLSTMTTAASRH